MVGRGRRRVAAVVRCQDEQVAVAHRRQDPRQAVVELLERVREPARVVPMTPEHVGLDEVREHQAAVGDGSHQLPGRRDPLGIRGRRMAGIDVLPRRRCRRSSRRRARSSRGREAAGGGSGAAARARSRAARRPPVGARVPFERARDHPADGVLAAQDSRAVRQASYSSSSGNDRLVGGDLEHAVGRRVDDPAPGALVLGAQALDDLGARRRDVPDHPAPGRSANSSMISAGTRPGRSGTAAP